MDSFREPPVGVRRWKSNWELALEQLPETYGVGADGCHRYRARSSVVTGECMREHELEWYRVGFIYPSSLNSRVWRRRIFFAFRKNLKRER